MEIPALSARAPSGTGADVDVVIVGAGAAGLHCAGIAGGRGLRVLLIDHSERVAEKIRISGGGHCNFTNREVRSEHFISENPQFCRSALARYQPKDFLALVEREGIAWHEKHKGQLFCDGSAEQIIRLLANACAAGGVQRWQPCTVLAVRHSDNGFELDTSRGTVRSAQLVVATGGLSIPKIGATDWGHRLAEQFGHRIVPTRPALVPLTFDGQAFSPFTALSGLALPVRIRTGSKGQAAAFDEDLLFTHRGLSGPAVLQISSYWQPGTPLAIDLTPGLTVGESLVALKHASRRQLGNALAEILPRRLAETWLELRALPAQRPLAECRDADLAALGSSLQAWSLTPAGTLGYAKAEVTAGGVDTRELQSQTMGSKRVAGLYFIGEVVDVTGWLGGYNFQWAWASAFACAQGLERASARTGGTIGRAALATNSAASL